MTEASNARTDQDQDQHRPPARRRRRRGLELAGVAAGLAAGVAITLTWLAPLPQRHPAASAVDSTNGPVLVPGAPQEPDPAALDAEWVAYSDHSTCADWAGGDGGSAIRLNSSQLAWFFSDTPIGRPGPPRGSVP